MDYSQAIVSIVMMIIFILVGLPLWWNTTKVYRADIGKDRIYSILSSSFKLKINIELYSDFLNQIEIDIIKETFTEFSSRIYDIDFRHRSTSFDEIVGNPFCEKLQRIPQINSLQFKIFIRVNNEISKMQTSTCHNSTNIIVNLQSGYNQDDLMNFFSIIMNSLFPPISLQVGERKLTEKKTKLPPSIGFGINFVLAISNPSEVLPEWDIKNAIKNYFEPYVRNFEYLGPFKTSSQVLYYFDPNAKPVLKDEKYYYSKSKLSLVINSLQSRLNTYTSSSTTLNFIIFVPEKKYYPLYFRRNIKGKMRFSNDFYSPRWGGIAIYNHDIADINKTVNIPLKSSTNIFLNQFNELFGIDIKEYQKLFPNDKVSSFIQYIALKLKIKKTYQFIETSLTTLSSLVKLLDEISNIVIKEDIANLIKQSVKYLESGNMNLHQGNIHSAYNDSRRAFELSESAFYDSSLLALLYFPEDQKYAIYVPLFFPISVPVVLSFFKAVKWFRTPAGNDKLKED